MDERIISWMRKQLSKEAGWPAAASWLDRRPEEETSRFYFLRWPWQAGCSHHILVPGARWSLHQGRLALLGYNTTDPGAGNGPPPLLLLSLFLYLGLVIVIF